MSLQAKAFIAVVLSLGTISLYQGVSGWRSPNLVSFLVYFVVAQLVSGMKIHLPNVTSTISVCFFFVLIGIVCLSLPEALLTNCSAVLVQYAWHTKRRPRLIQVLFNVASVSTAITVSHHVFTASWLQDQSVELSLRLAALALTYFIANTLPVAIIVALTEGRSLSTIWRDAYLWSAPYYFVAAATAGLFRAAQEHIGWQTAMLILPVIYLLYRSATAHMRRLEHDKLHAEETAALHLRTIESLAMAIEAKDHTTHDHLRRVQVYAVEVGKELKLNESELRAIRAASLLHDIGKIAVPEQIISKPGKLTPEEFKKMKIHPVVGAQIVQRAQFPFPVAPIVRHHHEKWDGSGYPDGLKGEEIPVGARIIAAVDCLDALASDRQYRRALPLDEAMALVAAEAGKAFDPAVIEILERRYVDLEKMARAQPTDDLPLDTEISIERGTAPAAGFEQSGESHPEGAPDASLPLSVAKRMEWLQNSAGHAQNVAAICSQLPAVIGNQVPWKTLVIYLRCEDKLAPAYVAGEEQQLFRALQIPLGEGIAGWVAENRRSIVNGNPSVESSYLHDAGQCSHLRSALAIPLEATRGMLGVLALYHAEADAFTREHLQCLSLVGSRLATAIESRMDPPPPAFQQSAQPFPSPSKEPVIGYAA